MHGTWPNAPGPGRTIEATIENEHGTIVETTRTGLAGTWLASRRIMRISDDNLHGRTVISNDGLAVGEISCLFVDTATWRIESLQVELRRESADRIGVQRGLFHAAKIDIPVDLVRSVGDAVVLAVDLDNLRRSETPAEPAPSLH
jgi:sporulation protein YlmC with PRC-barrel domain